MKKYEYHVLALESNEEVDVLEEMNKLGEEGWELVTSMPVEKGLFQSPWINSDRTSGYVLIFKRELK